MDEKAKRPWWRKWKLWAALAAIAGAFAVFFWLNSSMPRLALFWVFGLTLGFIVQRSRFCLVSAVSNCFLFRDTRLLEGVLGGLFVATIGFALVMYRLSPGADVPPTTAIVTPFGWHLVLGGVIFGFGMLLAGGCIVGNLFRIGEGALSAVLAFLGVLLGLGALQFTWPWWWDNYISRLSPVWLPAKMGWLGAVALTLAVIIILFIIVRRYRGKSAVVKPTGTIRAGLPSRLRGLGGAVFRKAWPLALGGVVLGLVNVAMFLAVDRPWTVTGELMSWAQGLFNLIGLPPPQFNAVPGT